MTSHAWKKEPVCVFKNDDNPVTERDDMTYMTIKVGFAAITAILILSVMLIFFIALT